MNCDFHEAGFPEAGHHERGKSLPADVDRYQANADDCRRKAANAPTQKYREQFLRLAEQWETMVEEAKQLELKPWL